LVASLAHGGRTLRPGHGPTAERTVPMTDSVRTPDERPAHIGRSGRRRSLILSGPDA